MKNYLLNIKLENKWLLCCSFFALLYAGDAVEAASGTFRSLSRRPSISNANDSEYQGRAITDEEKKQLSDLIVNEKVSIQEIDDFLKNKKINFSLNKDKGCDLIFYAASTGNNDKVKLLLNYGSDIDAYCFAGQSPLMFAMGFERNREMMKCLVECGADVNVCSRVGDNPLRMIIQHWKRPFNEEDIKLLVEHGVDIDKVFFNGEESTSLVRAMCDGDGDESLVRCLIDNGANINKTDVYGQTPLMMAASYGSLNVVKLLLDQIKVGSNLDSRMSYKRKLPLTNKQIYSGRNNLRFNINARNKKGKTALDYAHRNDGEREEIMSFLRKHGAKTGEEIDQERKSQ